MTSDQRGSSRQIICGLCKQPEETKITGPLFSKKDISAHQNCLLFSSGIFCSTSPTDDELFGFALKDTCHYCERNGATVGCEVKRCKRSYHYPCSIQDQARAIEDTDAGSYTLYCKQHDPEIVVSKISPNASSGMRRQKRHKSQRSQIGKDESKSALEVSVQLEKLDVQKRSKSTLDCRAVLAPTEPVPEESAHLENPNEQSLCDVGENNVNQGPPIQSGRSSPPPGTPSNESDPGDEENNVNFQSSSAVFWARCNQAGWTSGIFSELKSQLSSLGERVESQEASPQDYDDALDVLKASRVLTSFFTQLEQDMENKEQELQRKRTALVDAKAALGF
ncbi:hypothetical protein DNTS_027271 [Danionella cerebrum]|uniref:PHD-type domain-containing protein n=1 Tax=Danionella cerebrum TaxID=2873325 RepID=A0A553R4H6_9TELE|nr:hypothetical protein DNTS_027271 [Danionella translucida]